MSVTRPVVKTETLKKVKINPAWVSPPGKWPIRKVVLSPGRKQRDLGAEAERAKGDAPTRDKTVPDR